MSTRSRSIKKKIIYLNIGNRLYKYTETIEEILNAQPRAYIDLTRDSTAQPMAFIDLTREEEGNIPNSLTVPNSPRSPRLSDFF